MMKELTKRVGIRILLLAAIILLFCMNAFAEGGLSFPDVTQTDCAWDNGNLISETVHDLNGLPAVNSRGFYRAEYSWDERGNLLSEVYYGLNGEKAVADQGYAYAVYTYFTDRNENSHILTVDRYAPDGSRAEIPGEYSYRRDIWEGESIISSSYYNAKGELTRPSGGYAQILYHSEGTAKEYTVTKRYLDADGSPLIGNEGGEVVVSTYTTQLYMKDDLHVEYPALDMMLPEEVQGTGYEFEHLLLTSSIFTADNRKVLGAGRWHRQENTYDEKGNLLRTDYFGTDDEPVLASQGYACKFHRTLCVHCFLSF